MISNTKNTTAKLLLNNNGELRGVYCPGENNTFYRACDNLHRLKLVDGDFEETRIHESRGRDGLMAKFLLMKDENVYFNTNYTIQRINVSTGERTTVIEKIPEDFVVD